MTVPLPGSFRYQTIDADGVPINCAVGGDGPPLMPHGYPQTHLIWHEVAPRLARDQTVVLTDLRSYGDSGKPDAGPSDAGYSKRAMARDQLLGMQALGFGRFAVVGHDCGARVAHRLALDAPEAVSALVVLGIVPDPPRAAARRRQVRPRLLPLVLPRGRRRSTRAADRQ